MEQPIRVSRNWTLYEQIQTEEVFNEFTELGLYEKTIDPITREPVYLPLE